MFFYNLILVSLCHHYFRFFSCASLHLLLVHSSPSYLPLRFLVCWLKSTHDMLLDDLPLYCSSLCMIHYLLDIYIYVNKWDLFIMFHHYRPRCNVFTAFSALSRALKVAVAINCRSPCDKISQAMYIYIYKCVCVLNYIYIYYIDMIYIYIEYRERDIQWIYRSLKYLLQ